MVALTTSPRHQFIQGKVFIPSLMLHVWYFSLYVEQKEVSQQIKSLSNKIQLEQRSVATLRKTLNEVESQISDLDAAKEIAKQGNE